MTQTFLVFLLNCFFFEFRAWSEKVAAWVLPDLMPDDSKSQDSTSADQTLTCTDACRSQYFDRTQQRRCSFVDSKSSRRKTSQLYVTLRSFEQRVRFRPLFFSTLFSMMCIRWKRLATRIWLLEAYLIHAIIIPKEYSTCRQVRCHFTLKMEKGQIRLEFRSSCS